MPFDTPLAEEIWDKKYRFRSEASEDADLAATFDRVADAVAKAEKPRQSRGRAREAEHLPSDRTLLVRRPRRGV